MKKITILCAVMFAFASAFATGGDKKTSASAERHQVQKSQQFRNAGSATLHSDMKTSSFSGVLARTSQVPFFSEVFAGGIPPTWQNIDSSGSGTYWTWTTTGSVNSYVGVDDTLSLVGTSSANGYLKFDSDSIGPTTLGNYGVLITDAIDCSLHSSVRLSFNEYFAKFDATTPIFLNTARVYISTDGTNWTLIHAADNGIPNGGATPNPFAVGINISSIAAGQSTVYFKFSFTGDYSYWWYVDDLELSEVGAIDAGLFGILDPYNGCLLTNVEPITIGVLNDGADSLMNIPVYYSINGGTPIAEIIADTLAPGDSLVYTFTATADLSVAGAYNIVSYTVYPTDANTSNDTVSISTSSAAPNTVIYTMGFETTDDYSGYTVVDVDGDGRTVNISDTLSRSGVFSLMFPFPTVTNSDNYVISNCFDFLASNTYNIDFWFKVFGIAPSTPYDLQVYIGSTTDISTMTLLASPPTPGNISYTNVNTNFTVPADGLYYIAFRAYGTNVLNALFIDDITVDFGTGVNNPALNDAVLVYPNPSQGKIFIVNKGLNDGTAVITVSNTVGQIVSSISSENFVKETIDLSTQPDGLYTVQIRTQSGVINKTVMVSAK